MSIRKTLIENAMTIALSQDEDKVVKSLNEIMDALKAKSPEIIRKPAERTISQKPPMGESCMDRLKDIAFKCYNLKGQKNDLRQMLDKAKQLIKVATRGGVIA